MCGIMNIRKINILLVIIITLLLITCFLLNGQNYSTNSRNNDSILYSKETQVVQSKIFKVLVINFDPILESQSNKRLHVWGGWNDPHVLAQNYIDDLNQTSYNFALYKIIDWIDSDSYPAKEDGYQYTDSTYLAAKNSGVWHGGWNNYTKIIEDFNLVNRVKSGEIDEVFTFYGPYDFGFYESRMAGPNASGAIPLVCQKYSQEDCLLRCVSTMNEVQTVC